MGYDTTFEGRFALDRPLDEKTYTFMRKLNATRRMKRKLGPEYGVDGEFFVDGGGYRGQDFAETSIVDPNHPPSTQPGLWCKWCPTADRTAIEWDGGEKFYDYIQWIEYLIARVLEPEGYRLNGTVQWWGQDHTDYGCIVVSNNVVVVQRGQQVYATPVTACPTATVRIADCRPQDAFGEVYLEVAGKTVEISFISRTGEAESDSDDDYHCDVARIFDLDEAKTLRDALDRVIAAIGEQTS